MKKLVSIFGLLFFSTITFSQVGINTTDPKAQLEIKSSNQATPSNTDGILIPKINAFPLINPTSDQNSMMVYLTLDLPGKPKGFYYWNNDTTSWIGFTGDKGWELTGNSSTNPSTNFIGTTDDNDLIFKRDNIKSGLISTTNTALGKEALIANTTGNFNSAIGISALFSNTEGIANTANGNSALRANTTGDYNVANGVSALLSNTTGNNNTANGVFALISNITGDMNTASGVTSLYSNKAGSNATAIGKGAMEFSNDTTTPFENKNVAVGYESLRGSLTAANNTGNSNTAIGYQTLLNNSEGRENVAVGTNALQANEIAIQNTAVGVNALKSLIGGGDDSGSFNVAVGYNTLTNNEYGTFNTSIGSYSLEDNIFGSSNIAMGYFALRKTTANHNIAIGKEAMENNDAGSRGIAIGSSALANFGNTTTPFNNENIAIGYESLKGSSVFADNTGNSNTAIGYQTLLNNSTGSDNIAIGKSSLKANTIGTRNVAIGTETLQSPQQYNDNTAIGYNAISSSQGNKNTAVGSYALRGSYSNLTEQGNSAIGYYALNQCYGTMSTAIGFETLKYSSAEGNTAIGAKALSGVTFGTTGTGLVAVGYKSMIANTNGSYGTAIGNESMFSNTSGANNTALGFQSLYGNSLGSNNVAIGYQAGYSETGSNKLYIENSNSATPLIYGEFDNDLIRINGRTESIYTQLTANNDGQSSIYGYRTRDSQNDGTNYSRTGTNKAVSGYNLWGDLYTFGVTGHCYNDYTRTGGVLGADINGAYWSSLGYKNSAFTTYGVYATAVLATGTGRLAQPQNEFSIGGGFYGGIIGSWSKGTAIGHVASGSLFASYNSGNEYTAGKQIELVDTGNSKIAAYTVTSTENVIYKKGKIALTNGSARVNFDKNYTNLLGDIPIVTTTPMGQCNGLYIESIDKDGFVIKELNNGLSNVSVSWIAVGDRVDANTNVIAESILNKDFDENINQVMFNENNKLQSAKAVWTDGNAIQFGELPENLKQKNTTKKE